MNTPVYLDNNATTQVDPRVVEAMLPTFETMYGNASSSTHAHGWQAEELVALAREQVAAVLNAQPSEIIFTSGATESNNLAIIGVCQNASKNQPVHVVSAATEHRAILDPLEALTRNPERPATVTLLAPNDDGQITTDSLSQSLRESTRLVTLMSANNEIGVLNNIEALCQVARAASATFHCDASQAVGKIPVDVKQLGVDLLSLSAHKLYGPKGVGALYIRGGAARARPIPQQFGGGQEHGLRAGTLNVSGIVGLGKACELCQSELDAEAKRIRGYRDTLLQLLWRRLPDMQVNGTLDERLPGNLNLVFPGASSAALLGVVSPKLSLSASSACSSDSDQPSHVLKALGLSPEQQRESIRIGIGRFNTEEEIHFAAEVLAAAVEQQRR